MRVYQNGASIYMGGVGTHERAPRGEVKGWSPAAARRQANWLKSVDSGQLTEYGYALTLTMRETPASARELHAIRAAFYRRCVRAGMIRSHWVIEWQERGTPHLHMAAYFDHELDATAQVQLLAAWCETAADQHPEIWGQDLKPIAGAMGWLKYLAKHASRGVHHYQRATAPEGWTKTGRLWGFTGEWPVIEPQDYPNLTNAEFYRIRRMMRKWAQADARKMGDRRRLVYLKNAGQVSDKQKSRYLGASDWIPEPVMLRLVDFLQRDAWSDDAA